MAIRRGNSVNDGVVNELTPTGLLVEGVNAQNRTLSQIAISQQPWNQFSIANHTLTIEY